MLLFVAVKYTTDTNYFKEPGVGVPIHVRLEQGIDPGTDSIEFA